MKSRILAAAAAAVTLAGVSMETMAQAKPDVLVAQRQAAMKLIVKYFGPMGAMMKGAAPYNADIVARNAAYVETLSKMPWDGFDPSTSGEKSKAKADIYKEMDKFKAAASNFETEAAKLAAAARAKDEGAVKMAFGAVAKTCGACHDAYREK